MVEAWRPPQLWCLMDFVDVAASTQRNVEVGHQSCFVLTCSPAMTVVRCAAVVILLLLCFLHLLFSISLSPFLSFTYSPCVSVALLVHDFSLYFPFLPTPSSTEVEGRVELYISPSGPSWPVLGWILPFTFTSLLSSLRHIFCLFFSNHSHHDRLIDWLCVLCL